MKQIYGDFFGAFNDLVSKLTKEDDLNEWKNVRCIYECFRKKFALDITLKREVKKRKLNGSVEKPS